MHCYAHFLFHLFRYARHYCASNVSLSIFSLYCVCKIKHFFFDVRRKQRAIECEVLARRGVESSVVWKEENRAHTKLFLLWFYWEWFFSQIPVFPPPPPPCTLTACEKKMCWKSNWKLCIDGKSWKNINLNEECTLHAVCKLHSVILFPLFVANIYTNIRSHIHSQFTIRNSHSISTAHSLFGRW